MKIGINTLFLIPNQVGGTEYYTRSLLKALEALETDHEFVVFCNEENFDTFEFTSSHWKKVNCQVRATNRFARILYEQTVLPAKVAEEQCDILHSFGYFGPIRAGVPHILTVHDANWLDHPYDQPLLSQLVLRFLMAMNIQNAQVMITDSLWSKHRLSHHYPQRKKDIQVLYPGVETAFQPSTEKKSPYSEKFFLCVSGLYPHKKIPYLLEIWQQAQQELSSEYELVVVGKNGADSQRVQELVKQVPRIQWYPKLSLEELVQRYQFAEAFLFPSVYEGFGYPVYEALQSGAKVVVGKKELYHPDIREAVEAFSFEPEKDTRLMVSLLQKPRRAITLPVDLSYQESAKTLIHIYEGLQ